MRYAVVIINPESPYYGNWWTQINGNSPDRKEAGLFDKESVRYRNAEECQQTGSVIIVPEDMIDSFMLEWPVPKLRPKTSAERKNEPIYGGVLAYFPDALAAVARVSKAGNDKHNPGEPLHWARGKSTDQMDALARHILTPDVIDAETGEAELAQAVWRGLAQLQLAEERRLTACGIMPYSGIVPAGVPEGGDAGPGRIIWVPK